MNTMNRALIILSILIISLLVFPAVFGQSYDTVLINSKDWRDVYSGMMYAELIGSQGEFVLSQEDAVLKVELLPGTYKRILIIEPEEGRQYTGLPGLVASKGFDYDTIRTRESLNLELAGLFEGNSFIVVGDTSGYNAISAIPYALLTHSYVLFADRDNIDDVEAIIRERQGKVMLYGVLEEEVKEALSGFSPDTIDEGSRLDNNLAIAKRFLELRKTEQVWVVGGDTMVKPMFDPSYPIIFIGRTAVPLEIDSFLEESEIKSLVLIGNELAPMVNQFKQRYENSHEKIVVTILIGRSARQIDFGGDNIEALDSFPVPVPRLGVRVAGLFYNLIDKKLEVTYENTEDTPVYLSSSYEVAGTDGTFSGGDEQPIFLPPGRKRTVMYDLDISDRASTARFTIVYGEDRGTLDNLMTQSFDGITFIDIEDSSDVEILSVKYDRFNHALFVDVVNHGDVPAYADIEIDLMIDGSPETVFAPDIIRIAEGGTQEVVIRQRLTGLDLEDNEKVVGRASYSQRRESLFKTFEAEFELGRVIPGYVYVGGIFLAIIVFFLAFYFIFRKKGRHENY